MLGDILKAIVLLAFTTKSLAIIHWLILASSVFVKAANLESQHIRGSFFENRHCFREFRLFGNLP